MRILFSTDQIHLHGGIEKVMAVKANYFADVLGHEVTILTTEQKNKLPCYPLSSKIQLKDIAVNYNRTKSYFHPENLKKIPSHFRAYKETIKEVKPQVIISCNFAFDFYWLPFTFTTIPKFKEFHSSRYFEAQRRNATPFFKKGKYKLNDFIEQRFSKLVLLNPDEPPFYKTNNGVVVPNPISIPNKQASLQNKKAIAAGRIAPVKGFENAIRAWELVVKESPDWELHIYGQGEEAYIQSLQEIINSLQLQNRVFLQPATADLTETMLDYSIYVMSSHTECFPMVLLESLSIGLPIVSFDCPTGPRNIIANNEDGFLVENQNSAALAEKIVLLTQNDQTRIAFGNKAKQNSLRFSTEKVMLLWENLFKKSQQ
jgi:glycosyltransferase involved in cell wall biosynthesis